MMVFISDATGLVRCLLCFVSSWGAGIATKHPPGAGERVSLVFSGSDGTEMEALCEVTRTWSTLAELRFVAWKCGDGPELLLVDRDRVVN